MQMAIVMLNFKKLIHCRCSFVTLCHHLDRLTRSKAAILHKVREGKPVKTSFKDNFRKKSFNPSHAAIKISTNATAAEFICKNIFPTPVQVKIIIKNKIGDIQQIYLYQNVCK